MSKKTDLIVEEASFSEIDKIITKEFKNLVDLSKVDTKVKKWLDSGVYALNYICSKNLFGAIPVGRVSSFDGLTGTGKSLMVSSLMRDSQVDYIFLIETEGGGNSAELLEFAGVDLKKVRVIKANTFENYRVNKKTSKIEEIADTKFPITIKGLETPDYIYKEGATRIVRRFINAIEFNNITKTILMVMDSIGNVNSVREYSGTSDMGAKPKAINSFFRNFDLAFERTNIAFVFTNKLYVNIGNQFDPLRPTGGTGVEFNPSLSIRLADTAELDTISDKEMIKEKDRRKTALGSSIKNIRAKIIKSRFGTEFRQIPFVIDFAVGPAKYSGLFTLCRDFGIMSRSGSYYKIEGIDKSFLKKDFINFVRQDEKNILDIIQIALNEAERRIKNEKGLVNIDIEDSSLEENYDDMKKQMTRDMEV